MVQTSLVVDIECPIGEYKVVVNGRYINLNGKMEHRYYPHPNFVKHLMALWFSEFGDISKKVLSLDECIKIYTRCHVGFTSIYPFFDGNGRLARLISNIFMIKNGYLPLIVSNKQREKHIELLSNYNVYSAQLDNKSTQIVEENSYFDDIFEFFKSQYKNSQDILDELKI